MISEKAVSYVMHRKALIRVQRAAQSETEARGHGKSLHCGGVLCCISAPIPHELQIV